MAGETMQGTRLPDAVLGEPGAGWEAWDNGRAAPGSYMRVCRDLPPDHVGLSPFWYIIDPAGRPGNLATHAIEEHEDGTITVRPSIFDTAYYDEIKDTAGIPAITSDRVQGWHGFLERGVWRSC